MVRFVLMWVILFGAIGGFMYLATKQERRQIKDFGWKAVVSAAISLVVVVSMMFINHVQGV